MEQLKEPPQLSLVAQFDDINRISQSLLEGEDDTLIGFFNLVEEMRIQIIGERRQYGDERERRLKLEEECDTLTRTNSNLRAALLREIQVREKIQKERDSMFNKLNMVRQFLIDDTKPNESAAREKVLSCLNLPQLETVMEVDSSDNSLSDLDYDRTGENQLDVSLILNDVAVPKRKSITAVNQNALLSPKRSRVFTDDLSIIPDADIPVEMASEAEKYERRLSEPMQHEENENREPLVKSDNYAYLSPTNRLSGQLQTVVTMPELRYTPRDATFTQMSNLLNGSKMSQDNLPRMQSFGSKVEKRPHDFVMKKVFKPGEKCGPCGGSIGFCSSCYRCRDCRALCHIDCKEKVPIPCIPYVTPSQNNRKLCLKQVADYAPKTRPRIPAIIIHCCSEIEKRGLNEPGLYRTSGSCSEVKNLKDRILNSKSGMPVLSNYDVASLCSVIKDFFNTLDEPLVTRLLWRDFVRASEMSTFEEKRTLMYQAVSELPIANRDTLAYFIIHLQHVAYSPKTKMPISNLSKVLGPTIVGNSTRDLPSSAILIENKKQINVLETLLQISEDYWSNFIKDSPSDNSNVGMPDGRPSIGSRLCGGLPIQTGSLTPMKNGKGSQRSMRLKPLF